MSLLEELLPASYKGVAFLVTRSRTTGGKKDIRHSYPNSSKQTIEELGTAPRVIELNASITGDDYLQDRDQLLNTLDLPGAGVLVHPEFGRLENYVSRSWTLTEDNTELGDGKIVIVFEINDEIGAPIESDTVLGNVENASGALEEAVISDVAENYSVTKSFVGNFNAALDKANGVVDTFNEKTSLIQATADQINSFNSQISNFSANIVSLVQSPQNLADSINGLFTTIGNIYPSIEASLDVLAGFFDFGDSDVEIVPTTAGLAERKKNDDIINQTMQTLALSNYLLNASQVEFETAEDINDISNVANEQYQKIMANTSISPDVDGVVASDAGLSDETKSALTDLRVTTQIFFDQQRRTASQLVNVRTNLTSARLLSYQYYGDSSQGEALAALNNSQSAPSFIEGDVQVFTS